MLEATIWYPQEFINNCYSNLKELSFILMKDMVKFCGKTTEETAKSINEAQIKLKRDMNRIWRDPKYHSNKQESNQENSTTA